MARVVSNGESYFWEKKKNGRKTERRKGMGVTTSGVSQGRNSWARWVPADTRLRQGCPTVAMAPSCYTDLE